MGGEKRKLDAELVSAQLSGVRNGTSSVSSNRTSSASSRGSRGRGRGRGRGGTGKALPSSSPHAGARDQPSTPSPRKRLRRTKGEMLAGRLDSSPYSQRTTRHSSRLASGHQQPPPPPPPPQTPLDQDQESRSDISSMSSSIKSLSTEPTAPDKSFAGVLSPKAGSESDCPGDTDNLKQEEGAPETVDAKAESKEELQGGENTPEGAKNEMAHEEETKSGGDWKSSEHANEAAVQQPSENGEGSSSFTGALPHDIPRLLIPEDSVVSSEFGTPRELSPSDIGISGAPTPSEAAELSSSAIPSTSGRWRGGFRGTRRGARGARGKSSRGRGGRLVPIERDLSPKAGAMVQKLRHRQKELNHSFRKVASAQRRALLVLATRTEASILKDPKAHLATGLYHEVLDDLEGRLEHAHGLVTLEYNLREQVLNVWRETEEYRIKTNFERKFENIVDEHVVAAQGSFLESIEKRRQAEDDDHTETEGSDSEPETPVTQRIARGFDSSFVRKPEGAALYERAETGWEDLTQRAKIGEEIWPRIAAMNQEKDVPALADGDVSIVKSTNRRFSRLLGALVEACEVAEGSRKPPESTAADDRTSPLDTLATAALDGAQAKLAQTEPQRQQQPLEQVNVSLSSTLPPPIPLQPHQPRLDQRMLREPSRMLLPQPIPNAMPGVQMQDPRQYPGPQYGPAAGGLPPPREAHTPHPLPPLGGRHQTNIPSLSEHLRLPDPFSFGAPQHLPAPLGMQYSHRPSLYAQPPPPPPPHPHPHPRAHSHPLPPQPPLPPPTHQQYLQGGPGHTPMPGYPVYHPNYPPHLQYQPPPGPHHQGPPPPPHMVHGPPMHHQQPQYQFHHHQQVYQHPPPPPPPPHQQQQQHQQQPPPQQQQQPTPQHHRY
ncbi:hypothetical protein FQN57_003297 [Myotisia sp. PD_48]|nr:hypothetical protein FQN57_003297 [Myotisia sp. PD_48]